MKSLFMSVLAIVAASGVAHAAPGNKDEIRYPSGSIGYDALVAGDNERAILQISTSNRVSRNDPAKLINLGQAYARTGRTAEAAVLFETAMASREQFDLVLANGRVMSSKEAARRALSGLQTRFTSR